MMTVTLTEFLNEAVKYDVPTKARHLADILYTCYHLKTFNATIDGKGMITFLPNLNSKEGVEVKPRTTSFTRFIRYASQHPDYNFFIVHDWQPLQDYLVNWAVQQLGSDYWTFEEIYGKDIVTAYATGPQSCMRGRNAQLRLYVLNPEKVSLLKIYKQGHYVGRALVWKLDDGRTLLDRVYPGNGTISSAAKRYAKSKGWLHKEFDGIGSTITTEDNVFVTLKHVNNRRIPYLDTLRYLYKSTQDTLTLNLDRGTIIGDYTGYCHYLYNSNVPYLDGQSVPNLYDIETYRKIVHPETVAFNYRNGLAYFALKSTDTVYMLPDAKAFSMPSKIIEISGLFYTREDVRKRRGVNEFTPKAGSRPMVMGKVEVAPNGAKMVKLVYKGV